MPGVPWCDLVGVVSPEAGKALDHFHEQIGKPLDPLGAPVQRGRGCRYRHGKRGLFDDVSRDARGQLADTSNQVAQLPGQGEHLIMLLGKMLAVASAFFGVVLFLILAAANRVSRAGGVKKAS